MDDISYVDDCLTPGRRYFVTWAMRILFDASMALAQGLVCYPKGVVSDIVSDPKESGLMLFVIQKSDLMT